MSAQTPVEVAEERFAEAQMAAEDAGSEVAEVLVLALRAGFFLIAAEIRLAGMRRD